MDAFQQRAFELKYNNDPFNRNTEASFRNAQRIAEIADLNAGQTDTRPLINYEAKPTKSSVEYIVDDNEIAPKYPIKYNNALNWCKLFVLGYRNLYSCVL